MLYRKMLVPFAHMTHMKTQNEEIHPSRIGPLESLDGPGDRPALTRRIATSKVGNLPWSFPLVRRKRVGNEINLGFIVLDIFKQGQVVALGVSINSE